MRNYLKNIYYWVKQFVESIVSLLNISLFSSWKVPFCFPVKESACKEAFVLGNGPSMKEALEKDRLLNEILTGDVIVMNRFANSNYFRLVKPRYYILLDPIFYDDKHLREDVADRKMFLSMNDIDWDMTLFLVNGHNDSMLKSLLTNPHIYIVKYNGTRFVGFHWLQNLIYRCNMGIPSTRNVLIPAIQLMINIGYKELYLYGAEFSWTKTIDVDPKNNKVFMNDRHFYNKEDIHYYEKGWYKWYLEAIIDMLGGMDQLTKYALSRKVRIINRTKGSFVDAFEYENPDLI